MKMGMSQVRSEVDTAGPRCHDDDELLCVCLDEPASFPFPFSLSFPFSASLAPDEALAVGPSSV